MHYSLFQEVASGGIRCTNSLIIMWRHFDYRIPGLFFYVYMHPRPPSLVRSDPISIAYREHIMYPATFPKSSGNGNGSFTVFPENRQFSPGTSTLEKAEGFLCKYYLGSWCPHPRQMRRRYVSRGAVIYTLLGKSQVTSLVVLVRRRVSRFSA